MITLYQKDPKIIDKIKFNPCCYSGRLYSLEKIKKPLIMFKKFDPITHIPVLK